MVPLAFTAAGSLATSAASAAAVVEEDDVVEVVVPPPESRLLEPHAVRARAVVASVARATARVRSMEWVLSACLQAPAGGGRTCQWGDPASRGRDTGHSGETLAFRTCVES